MSTIQRMASHSALGKKTAYESHYNSDKLFSIARKTNRDLLGLGESLPFFGIDIWNHYEVSWLNPKGKPIAGLATITYDCTSPNIIESKSLKLYFNTLNNTQFKNIAHIEKTITNDLTLRVESDSVQVRIIPIAEYSEEKIIARWSGTCLDTLDIECSVYSTQPDFLSVVSDERIEETVYSDLLKSQCLVTNQPDFCSVQMTYTGHSIDHAGLLRYIVSFRDTNEFHEQCIEKIFLDVLQKCKPEKLSVYGRSTRRGGIDINAYRSTESSWPNLNNMRLCRQ